MGLRRQAARALHSAGTRAAETVHSALEEPAARTAAGAGADTTAVEAAAMMGVEEDRAGPSQALPL